MKTESFQTLKTVKLFQDALAKGINPKDVVNKLSIGLEISELEADKETVDYIKSITTPNMQSKLKNISKPSVEFLSKVVKDGRYIETWNHDIGTTALNLGINLSESEIDDIRNLDINDFVPDAIPDEAYARVLTYAIAVVVTARSFHDLDDQIDPVIDFSEVPKL